jgi:inositol 1,4,5-triphosphate receptor type 1/inositol 1,4,5-triphosphate receptor type 3
MVSLIDDKCKVNSGKLVKKFPFDTLSDLIKVSGRCWPLKRNLRAFLNRLYYY